MRDSENVPSDALQRREPGEYIQRVFGLVVKRKTEVYWLPDDVSLFSLTDSWAVVKLLITIKRKKEKTIDIFLSCVILFC